MSTSIVFVICKCSENVQNVFNHNRFEGSIPSQQNQPPPNLFNLNLWKFISINLTSSIFRKVYSSCSCIQESGQTSPWWKNETQELKSPLDIPSQEARLGDALEGYCPFDCSRQFMIIIGTRVSKSFNPLHVYVSSWVFAQTRKRLPGLGLRYLCIFLHTDTDDRIEQSCKKQNIFFVGMLTCFALLGSTGRVGNQLLSLRAVEPRDKSAGIIIMVSLLSLFVFLPSPIIFANIMGKN